jgi:hypothetical protein
MPRTAPSDMRIVTARPTIQTRPSLDPAPRFYTASATTSHQGVVHPDPRIERSLPDAWIKSVLTPD